MKGYKNITINQLLKLLSKSVKINAKIIKKNKREALKFAEKENVSETLQKKVDLIQLNEKLASKNEEYTKLYNYILNFFKNNWREIEVSNENHNIEFEENQINESNTISYPKISNNIHYDKLNAEIKTKSINELEELQELYISIEDYEKCADLQILINIKKQSQDEQRRTN